jgi:hypothetical protein
MFIPVKKFYYNPRFNKRSPRSKDSFAFERTKKYKIDEPAILITNEN